MKICIVGSSFASAVLAKNISKKGFDVNIIDIGDISKVDQNKYLKQSVEWHREVAHYHMYMERNFAKQLEEHTADSAPDEAKQSEAEPQLATATKAK